LEYQSRLLLIQNLITSLHFYCDNFLAMQETQVQSLGWEAPLEKGMATHSSVLTWRMPWTVDPDGYGP